jgi:hypothetical protein
MFPSQRRLCKDEVRRFEKHLAASQFWNLPSEQQEFGFDGTECVIEAVHRDVYHVVDRWSPRDSPFAEFVQFMLELPNFNVDLSGQTPRFVSSFAALEQQSRAVKLDDVSCQRCGRRISSNRIQLMPSATHCWECQTELERGRDK